MSSTIALFNHLFNNIKLTDKKFPREGNDGTIKIIGNKIICEGNHGIQSCEVNIDNIQYAYVIVDRNEQSLLFLFDYHQNYLPTMFSGFRTVYEDLSRRFVFNDTAFFDNVNKTTIVKKQIWRKKYDPDYEILTSSFTDYDKGFEIQDSEKQFISWDTHYDSLLNNPAVVIDKTPYDQKIAKFRYPVRIGNILFHKLCFYIHRERTDVAVLHFFSYCHDIQGTDKSYADLKTTLNKDLDIDQSRVNYERDDQNCINFILQGMSQTLVYWYDCDLSFDAGYTYLSIDNRREYPALLIDETYENDMVVSNSLVLPDRIGISENYKNNSRIKRRQQKINELFGSSTLIWIDDINNKIGFSSNKFSQTFGKGEIKSFTLENIRPAKGAGGSYLKINFFNNSPDYSILMGNYNCFDSFLAKIKSVTNKEIIIGPEYDDV